MQGQRRGTRRELPGSLCQAPSAMRLPACHPQSEPTTRFCHAWPSSFGHRALSSQSLGSSGPRLQPSHWPRHPSGANRQAPVLAGESLRSGRAVSLTRPRAAPWAYMTAVSRPVSRWPLAPGPRLTKPCRQDPVLTTSRASLSQQSTLLAQPAHSLAVGTHTSGAPAQEPLRPPVTLPSPGACVQVRSEPRPDMGIQRGSHPQGVPES